MGDCLYVDAFPGIYVYIWRVKACHKYSVGSAAHSITKRGFKVQRYVLNMPSCNNTKHIKFIVNIETHKSQKLSLLHLYTNLFRKDIFLTLQNKLKVRSHACSKH